MRIDRIIRLTFLFLALLVMLALLAACDSRRTKHAAYLLDAARSCHQAGYRAMAVELVDGKYRNLGSGAYTFYPTYCVGYDPEALKNEAGSGTT